MSEHDAFVIVTPLQPPFTGDRVIRFQFEGYDKLLAVSESDAAKINDLFGAYPVGRQVILSADDDPERIRVGVVPS